METIDKFKLLIIDFINYLEYGLKNKVVFDVTLKKEIPTQEIEYQLNILNKLLDFLSLSNQEVKEKQQIFIDYPLISSFLEDKKFSNQEKIEIFFYFIEKNNISFQECEMGNPVLIDVTKLRQLYSPNSNPEAFDKLIQKIDLNKIIISKDSQLSKQEIQIKKYIMQIFDDSLAKDKISIQMHTSLDKHYFKKKDTYTEKDLQYIRVALKYLGISDKDRTIILNSLKKNLKKRTEVVVEEKRRKEETFDYQDAFLKVSEVVDLKNMFPKKSLTLEERIYYLALLTKMNVSKEERYLFLRNCEMYANMNPIAMYITEYEKLKYYEEKVGLQQELAYLEELAQEAMLSNNEDYAVWKESMQAELKKIYAWIPKNFAYEVEEASKLILK